MKFPTSSSSLTVSSPAANVQASTSFDPTSPTSATATQVTSTSMNVSTVFQEQPVPNKKSESENVTSSLTTTAGNFFRRYTGTPNSQFELSQMKASTTPPVEAEKIQANVEVPLEATAKHKVVSNKPKPMKSRKISRAPPPPTPTTPSTSKVKKTLTSPSRAVQRPCQTHSFHTEAKEVQQMEISLLKLLNDFNSGKLRAFGQGCSMEQMSSIRDQQESLAKLHFDIGAKQDALAPLSEEGLRTANDNMDKLMGRLEKLSVAIGQLNPASSAKNSPSVQSNEIVGSNEVMEPTKVDR